MIRTAIALCLCLAVLACSKGSEPAQDTGALVRIEEAEDTRQWDAAAMEPLLAHEDASIRARAALAAGRIGDPGTIHRLADLINKDADESVAVSAVFAIGEIESAEGADVLLQALHSSKASLVRAAAIEGLGKIAAALPEGDAANRKHIGTAILDALKSRQPDGHFTLLALTAALRAKPDGAAAVITTFLKSTDARIRQDSLNALARLRSKESLNEVRALLDDSDSLTRANAARVLGAAADKESVSQLSILMSSDTDSRVRVAATRALASIADPGSAPALLKRSDAPRSELLEIATALGRVLPNTSNAEAITFLTNMRKTDPEVEIALAKIDPNQYVSGVAVALESGNGQMVSAVAQALGELAPSREKARALAMARELAQSKETPEQSMYDVLQALKALKAPDLTKIALAKLKSMDVVTRAAAADVLAEVPPSPEITQALVDALHATASDRQNDAALSIVGALRKSKDSAAAAALLEAAQNPDHLIRRKANPSGKVGPVASRNKHEDYVRAISRVGKQPKATLTTDKGVITIQFYPADAPLTVDSFIQLAQAHFFDGLTFHRVVPNFVIQGGDPRGDGNGGPGYTLRCEINMQPYDTGAVGMALSGKDTGGSQFFITHSPQPHLDGGYTVFAHVIAGQDVVNRIERDDRIRTVTIQE